MPVTAAPAINRYTGNGVTTVFAYGFRIFASADLQVLVNDVLQVGGYTVSGVDAPGGGNVTFTGAPASGVSIVLRRAMPYERTTDYQAGGDLLESTLDRDQDAPVMMVQQVAAEISRVARLPLSSTVTDPVFPPPGAEQFIRWNAAGTALEAADVRTLGSVALPISPPDGGTGGVAQAVEAFRASRNLVLNPEFTLWERGVLRSNPTTVDTFSGYVADRWQANRTGDASGLDILRSASGDSPERFDRCLIMQRPNGNSTTQTNSLYYTASRVDSLMLSTSVVSLSFWAKAGANFSAAGGLLSVRWRTTNTHSGTDAKVYAFASPADPISDSVVLTTSWQRFTFIGIGPAGIQQWGLIFNWTPVGTAGADDTVRITGVQVAPAIYGSYHPPFLHRVESLERELCAHYYERFTFGTNAHKLSVAGNTTNTAGIWRVVQLARKRIAPVMRLSGATWTLSNLNAPTVLQVDRECAILQFIATATGVGSAQLASGFIEADAEI